jgi:hypothetical protein
VQKGTHCDIGRIIAAVGGSSMFSATVLPILYFGGLQAKRATDSGEDQEKASPEKMASANTLILRFHFQLFHTPRRFSGLPENTNEWRKNSSHALCQCSIFGSPTSYTVICDDQWMIHRNICRRLFKIAHWINDETRVGGDLG